MPERDWQRDWKLCQRATPGPWGVCLGSGHNLCTAICTSEGKIIADCLTDYMLEEGYAVDDHVPNMIFIAEAREGWLAALEKVRELERQVGELGTQILEARERITEACHQIDEYTMPQTAVPDRALLEQALKEVRRAGEILDKAYTGIMLGEVEKDA